MDVESLNDPTARDPEAVTPVAESEYVNGLFFAEQNPSQACTKLLPPTLGNPAEERMIDAVMGPPKADCLAARRAQMKTTIKRIVLFMSLSFSQAIKSGKTI